MGSLPSSMTRGVLVIVYGCCCSGLYVFFCVFCNFVCSREICVSLNFSDWEKSHHLLQVTREGLFFYEITWKCSPGVLVIMYGYRCSCLYVVLCVSPNFFHWEKLIFLSITLCCLFFFHLVAWKSSLPPCICVRHMGFLLLCMAAVVMACMFSFSCLKIEKNCVSWNFSDWEKSAHLEFLLFCMATCVQAHMLSFVYLGISLKYLFWEN